MNNKLFDGLSVIGVWVLGGALLVVILYGFEGVNVRRLMLLALVGIIHALILNRKKKNEYDV